MSSDTVTVPEVGSPMPDITLVGAHGETANLEQIRNGSRAVVYFLRTAGCPVCVAHARRLERLSSDGRLGEDVRVFLVAPGEAAAAAALARRVGGSASETWASGSAHSAAGLGSFLTIRHSGTFVVDVDGSIAYTRTAMLPTNGFKEKELLHALSR